MIDTFDRSQVHASVSADEIAHAVEAEPADFPDIDSQDVSPPALFAAKAVVPRTPHQAAMNYKRMRVNHTPIGGVGLCWYDLRWFGWALPSLWPTAESGTIHGAPKHHYRTFKEVPFGISLGAVNGRSGHGWFSLGGGFCNTSDYHENGYNGVALISNIVSWCGAIDWWGIETVNGVDTYNPKPRPPKLWTKAELIAQLRRDLARAKKNHAPQRKIDSLEKWIKTISATV